MARFIGITQPNTMVFISTVQPLQNQEFLCAGTPLIRQFLLGQISNKDGFFEVEKQSYFLIRTVFLKKLTLTIKKLQIFGKKIG